jgi:hypothetical protein
VGFESSDVARRRLAAMAMSNRRVQEALALPDPAPAWADTGAERSAPLADGALADRAPADRALARSLEVLVQDIADTPGAGGALLATFAEQTRVLRLVAEASRRAPGAPLPPAVLDAVRHALDAAAFTSMATDVALAQGAMTQGAMTFDTFDVTGSLRV